MAFNPRPSINFSSVEIGDGIAGSLVAGSCMIVFLVGIPALRPFLEGAIVLGLLMAGCIRLIRRIPSAPPPKLFE
jgi:hypothetical protein